MAATATVEQTISLGGTAKLYTGTIALDASYPSGGEALDVSSNERLDIVIAGPNSGYVFEWDAANQKLKAMYADYSNGSDGVLIEVPDTTDLSAVTAIPFVAIGQ
jgi:hypothetical protein